MLSYIQNSASYKLSHWIGNFYKNSIVKKVFDQIGSYYDNSATHKAIYNYLNRKSSYQYTITYKVLSAIGRILDILVGKIHDFFAEQIRVSTLMSFFNDVKKEAISSVSSLIITAVLAFTAGYSVVNTVRNSWSTLKLEGVLVLCIACVIAGMMSGKWKASIKNSFFIKLYHFIWE